MKYTMILLTLVVVAVLTAADQIEDLMQQAKLGLPTR